MASKQAKRRDPTVAPLSFPIVLIGYMAAGKTTVGQCLARKIDRKFVDLDSLIEAEFQQSITEIWQEHGEQKFRSAEREHLHQVVRSSVASVIATGGGAILDLSNRNLLHSHSCVIFLDPPFSELCRRIRTAPGLRPLADIRDDRELEKHWQRRLDLYVEIAWLRLSGVKCPEESVDEIVQWLSKPETRSLFTQRKHPHESL